MTSFIVPSLAGYVCTIMIILILNLVTQYSSDFTEYRTLLFPHRAGIDTFTTDYSIESNFEFFFRRFNTYLNSIQAFTCGHCFNKLLLYKALL